MRVQKQPPSSLGITFLFICLSHFCVDFMLGVWPVFKTMMQLDLARAGLLASLCALIGETFQSISGTLSDRGYQKLLVICGVVLAAVSALFSYTNSYIGFLCLLLCTYIGSAAFHPTAVSLLGSLVSKHSSSLIGGFSAAGMLGLGLSQVTFSNTYMALEGATAYLAIPSLLLSFGILFWLNPRPPEAKQQGHSEGFPFKTFVRFFKNPSLRILYLIMIGNQIALWSFLFLLPDFLLSRNYETWIVYGGAHLVLMIGSTVCPPLAGYIADRTSIKQVLTILLICAALLVSFVLLPLPLTEGQLFCLLFTFGGVANSISPLVWSLGGRLVPANRGLVSAFLMGFVWIVSETLGMGLSGVLATLFSTDAPAKALMCMAVPLMLSTGLIFWLPKTEEAIELLPIGETSS